MLAEIADALDKITVDELIANAAHQSRISELGTIGPSIPFVREVLSLRGRFGMAEYSFVPLVVVRINLGIYLVWRQSFVSNFPV